MPEHPKPLNDGPNTLAASNEWRNQAGASQEKVIEKHEEFHVMKSQTIGAGNSTGITAERSVLFAKLSPQTVKRALDDCETEQPLKRSCLKNKEQPGSPEAKDTNDRPSSPQPSQDSLPSSSSPAHFPVIPAEISSPATYYQHLAALMHQHQLQHGPSSLPPLAIDPHTHLPVPFPTSALNGPPAAMPESGSTAAVPPDVSPPANRALHICPACAQTFSRAHDLKRHTNTHTGEKKFECSACKRRYARKDALKRHRCGMGNEGEAQPQLVQIDIAPVIRTGQLQAPPVLLTPGTVLYGGLFKEQKISHRTIGEVIQTATGQDLPLKGDASPNTLLGGRVHEMLPKITQQAMPPVEKSSSTLVEISRSDPSKS